MNKVITVKQAIDIAYLQEHGASILQVLAWCATYPKGGSRFEDMDEYLRGNDR